MLNLRKVLSTKVAEEGRSQPFLLSIGERAEALAELYEDRQITTRQALERFEQLAQEAVEAETQRQQLGLDGNAFAIYTVLAASGNGIPSQRAREIDEVFARFPNYRWSDRENA